MAENKTKATKISPLKFLAALDNEQRRKDGRELLKLFREVTGEPARMWGPTIIGFGTYHYRYESGREGDMLIAGFSPRTASQVLYIGQSPETGSLLAKLGKHKTSKGCVYVNKLDDIDRVVLKKLIQAGVAATRKSIGTVTKGMRK
jgi:Domain of unknown function (DU1801)